MKPVPPFIVALLALAWARFALAVSASITPDPLPACYAKSGVFRVRVNHIEVPVVSFSGDYDYATLTAGQGACDVEVLGGSVGSCTVSPLKLNIHPAVTNNLIRFKIDQPQYLIVSPAKQKRLVLAIDPPGEVPARSANVVALGADPTGRQSSTVAIQKAIDAAAEEGGGVVSVPAGVFAITNLVLRSHVSLYLAPGAVLRATGEPADFHLDFHKDSQRHDGTWLLSTAENSDGIKVFGRGTIDGDGRRYSRQKHFGNHLLIPITSSGFVADGIVLRDSASWGFVPVRCRNLTVRNVKMFNALDIGENDGIDVCECQSVRVQRCVAISLDDPFSTKTMSGASSDISRRWYGAQQENRDIEFDDCIGWTRCFAFKVGAGVVQPQSAITIRHCVALDCAHGFGISHEWGHATVQNVLVDGLDIEQVSCDCLGRSWAQIFIKRGGSVRDVTLRHITVRDRGNTPFNIHGLNETSTVDGVTLQDVRMPNSTGPARTAAELGIDSQFATNVTVSP